MKHLHCILPDIIWCPRPLFGRVVATLEELIYVGVKDPPGKKQYGLPSIRRARGDRLAILTCKASSLTQTGTIAKFLDRSGQEKLTKTHR